MSDESKPRLLWFCFTSFCDWSRKLAPLSQPIRYKTETSQELVARVFPRFAQSACLYFEFSLKIKGIFLLVIGYYNYFGFGFATVNQKALYLMISGLS